MRVMVVYDSVRGNTQAIAEAIAAALPGGVVALAVSEAVPESLETADLLMIGSPTHGAMPTEAMQSLLERISPPKRGGRVAAFDTRLTWPFLAKWGGFAADKIALNLSGKGWELATAPAGFYVSGLLRFRLKAGQVERAETWARSVLAAVERE